jgi:putative acetyltransferase
MADPTPAAVIVPYRPEFREAFERLNRAWLEEHDLLEPLDLEYLRDPEGRILSGGGQLFIAVEDGEAVGTCAAIRASSETVELAKLAVAPKSRRRGLGRRLSLRVIAFAREKGASRVVLTSNTALTEALRLYESLGFRYGVMPADVPYVTADVYMTLQLI